jgi:hypothetical protein
MNRPIDGVDLDGLEWHSFKLIVNEKTGKPQLSHVSTKKTHTSLGITDVLPLVYFVEYNGEEYKFFSNNYPGDPNTVNAFDDWLGSAENMDGFEERFQSQSEFYAEIGNEVLEEYAYAFGMGKGFIRKTGTIYEVPGSYTRSGKPYIGRHNKPKPQETRKAKDGRDRSKAKVIDTYDPANVEEGQYKEQKAMDDKGGLPNLDNKRREVNVEKQKALKRKYGG